MLVSNLDKEASHLHGNAQITEVGIHIFAKELVLPSAEHDVHALGGIVHLMPCARYQRGSEVCQKLGESLAHLTGSEERELFDFGRRAGEAAPLMLILDRRDDPVTPLLLQWTFQVCMSVHRHKS